MLDGGSPELFDGRVQAFQTWNWPARSPDLKPLDFYFWDSLKAKVCTKRINSKEELRQVIQGLDPVEIERESTNAVMNRILK